MQTGNVPKGTFQITLASGIQYFVMGLFYIAVTKTNSLTQADIGVLSILMFLSSLIILVTELALPTALTKFASESVGRGQMEEAASINKAATKTVVTLTVIGCVTAALLSYQLSQYFFGSLTYLHLIIFMLAYTLVFGIVTVFSSALQALSLFGKMALVTVTFIVVSRSVAVVLAVLKMGLEGVVVGYIAGAVAALAASVVFLRGKFPKTRVSTSLKPMLKFSFPLFISSLILLVLNWADVVIVTAITGDYTLTGIYYIAVNSVTALSILWIPLSTTIMPTLSAKHGLKKSDDITRILSISSRYILYVVLPACVGLTLISSTALSFFYGPSYLQGALPLSILSIVTIVTAFYALLTTALTALGKTAEILKLNSISTLTSVTILVVAVLPFKIVGAASARLIAQTISVSLALYLLRKEVRVQIDKEALWKSVLASVAIMPFLLVFEATLGQTLAVTERLVIEVGTSLVIYAFCLYILKALKSQDFELIRRALPKALSRVITIAERIMT